MNIRTWTLALLCIAAALTGCGDDDSTTAAPPAGTSAASTESLFISGPAAPSGDPVRGIACEASEGVATHIHTGLAIVLDGTRVKIPSDIGIDTRRACLYWLHTHADQGVMHVESPLADRAFTLGDFFAVWGYPLSKDGVVGYTGPVTAWVDGKAWPDDPASIPLVDRQTIVLSDADIADPPTVDFSELG